MQVVRRTQTTLGLFIQVTERRYRWKWWALAVVIAKNIFWAPPFNPYVRVWRELI